MFRLADVTDCPFFGNHRSTPFVYSKDNEGFCSGFRDGSDP